MDNNSEEETVKRVQIGRYALASITKDKDGQVLYGCKECPVKNHDKEILEHHLFMHYNEYRFLCGICGVGLKRREHLERHTQGHLEVRPHTCQVCGKAFKRKEHLNIHSSIHSGDKSLYCSICRKSFYRKDHLQKHIQTHSRVIKGRVATDDYGEVVYFKQEPIDSEYEEKAILPDDPISDEEIKMEIDESYEDPLASPAAVEPEVKAEVRPFACAVCDKAFKRRDHLKVHSYTHVKRENGCDECGKAFHSPELLLDHVSRVHGDDSPSSPIELPVPVQTIVGTEIADEPPVIEDLLVPRGPKSEYRPHECTICHRKFKRRQHLKVHGNVHLKVAPTIWCSLCHVGFFDNRQFEDHQCIDSHPDNADHVKDSDQKDSTTHDARKENNFPVEYIQVEENIKIVDETRLQALAVAEPHIPTPLRVYVCKYCAKPFKRKDHYRIHLNIHTGVKSFFCPYCDKGFYRKDHMKKHAQVHEKAKPPPKPKTTKQLPALFPIQRPPKPHANRNHSNHNNHSNHKNHAIKPEITIHAPSNTKLRVPLSINVPYKMVMSLDNGEQRAVTVDPNADRHD